MGFYRKKPVTIEAVKWDGYNRKEIQKFGGLLVRWLGEDLLIRTVEGDLHASQGDWIIRGVKGEIYPCKPDIFDLTYEKVEPSA